VYLCSHAARSLGFTTYQALLRVCRKALRPIARHGAQYPDGSWGSTWHPWIIDGKPEIPFQEDSNRAGDLGPGEALPFVEQPGVHS